MVVNFPKIGKREKDTMVKPKIWQEKPEMRIKWQNRISNMGIGVNRRVI